MKLETSEVVFHPLSYADENSRVFSWEGNLYRAINCKRRAFYEHLLSEGIVRDLVRRQLLIDTEVADLELDGYSLVLKHRTVPFVSYCYEWCGEMLKAAALSVLELEKELLKRGLTLQDAHPWNVLFTGSRPVWIDFGSLVPAYDGEPWYAREEFSAFFTRPLRIMAAGHGRVGRCLLRDGYCGVQQREAEALTGTLRVDMIRAAKAGAKEVATKAVPAALRPFASRAIRFLRRPSRSPSMQEQASGIDDARREIESIRLAPTVLSNYYGADFPDFAATSGWTDKHRSVAQILAAKKPGSVLDIGSNRGWYSQLAARNGAQVVAVDTDECAVMKLFSDAVAGELAILPLVADFRDLSPGTALTAPPAVAPVSRLGCDMVLALALVHHLVFKQYLNFDQIACGLSAFARKWLAIEFVGPNDLYVKEWMNDRFSWYTLDTLMSALGKEFNKIELFPSNMEHRQILLCER